MMAKKDWALVEVQQWWQYKGQIWSNKIKKKGKKEKEKEKEKENVELFCSLQTKINK